MHHQHTEHVNQQDLGQNTMGGWVIEWWQWGEKPIALGKGEVFVRERRSLGSPSLARRIHSGLVGSIRCGHLPKKIIIKQRKMKNHTSPTRECDGRHPTRRLRRTRHRRTAGHLEFDQEWVLHLLHRVERDRDGHCHRASRVSGGREEEAQWE